MCQFKFCAGAHQCFLKDVSPCPSAVQDKTKPAIEISKHADFLSTRSKGFLDRDQLVAALGLEGHQPQPPKDAKIFRIASKLRLVVSSMSA